MTVERFKDKVAFVVATKDRPSELCNMLTSLDSQLHKPDQIIIVDGSAQPIDSLVREFSHLPIEYLQCLPPSAAKQRNIGIKLVKEDITLIGFFDDDIVLETESLNNMLRFWENAPPDLAGATFNMINHPQPQATFLKGLPITETLGLYSRQRGMVLPSGFQTMIGNVSESIFIQWLPTTATVWRKDILSTFHFDEWFSGYSYLEDLDFSYRIGKKYRLAVVENARYYHYPGSGGRGSSLEFGKREVLNRIYFVKKHQELSLSKCYLALIVKIFLSLIAAIKEGEFGYIKRVAGNIAGFGQALIMLRNMQIKE
jgi:GT2 family glycosyltransferase